MGYKQNIKFEETGLKVGESYTLLKVSEFMANTIKTEITITGFKEVESYAQYKNLLMICFKQKGKRKEQGFYLKASDLFLRGFGHNILIDSDTEKGFKGNGLLNCVCSLTEKYGSLTPENLRNLINNYFVFGNKAIVVYTFEDEVLGKEKVLFPELAEEHRTEHAVLNRILN